jgi:hypothetical protein
MADHDPGDSAPDHAPGWLFRLNTTLGARLNTPAWMAPGAAVPETRRASIPEPEPDQAPGTDL